MFLIGGVHPKITVLDSKPEICPVCGLAQAYYKRIDHYVNLFFIPLFRIRKGDPILMCDRCERNIHELGEEYSGWLEPMDKKCPDCGRSLHPEFRYCPFCSKPVQ
jgi:rubrerythrin